MKAIEPDYKKACKMFGLYWSFYLISLCLYYQTLMIEQFYMYLCMFWMIYDIYKEKYELSNSLTEIFYDFQNDPILLYEEGKLLKANRSFITHFGYLTKVKDFSHHSQMLQEIENPKKIIFEYTRNEQIEKISLLDIIRNRNEFNEKEIILRRRAGEKIYLFSFYKLENIYNYKYVLAFKDSTHIHQLQKAKNQVEFKSVIMG